MILEIHVSIILGVEKKIGVKLSALKLLISCSNFMFTPYDQNYMLIIVFEKCLQNLIMGYHLRYEMLLQRHL